MHAAAASNFPKSLSKVPIRLFTGLRIAHRAENDKLACGMYAVGDGEDAVGDGSCRRILL